MAVASVAYHSKFKGRELLGLKLFDKNLNIKWEKDDFFIGIKDPKFIVRQTLVNDEGEVFLLARNYTDIGIVWLPLFGTSKSENNLYKAPYEILTIKDNNISRTKIEFKDVFLINFMLKIDKNSILHGIGYYCKKENVYQLDGIASAVIDPKTGILSGEQTQEFSNELIKAELTSKEQERIDKKIAKGEDVGFEDGLDTKDIIAHKDGTYSLVGEVFKVETETIMTTSGSYTRTYYVYSDMVITRVDSTGKIGAINKIHKYRKYAKPDGNSIAYDLDNKLAVFFVDERKYYSPEEDDKALSKEQKRSKDVLTLFTIDPDGTAKRNCIFDFINHEGVGALPTKMNENTFAKDGELLVYLD